MPTRPRWFDILKETLSDGKTPTYTLSTVETLSTGATVPRARSVIHRRLITPTAGRPLLLTTTDIRSAKAHQLRAHAGAAEATFWFRETETQVRVAARAHLLPDAAHAWREAFPARALVGEGREFDWEAERRAVFERMSGHLRATFARPTPGTPMGSYEEGEAWPVTLPLEAEGELLERALSNFALVVLDPMEVEYLELAPIPNRRTRWLKNGEEWVEQIVIP